MHSIGLIAPYFGQTPSGFDFWLKCADKNESINFHLLGDCFSGRDLPRNVFLHECSFSELQRIVSERLGAMPFNHPYKLCDYKPTYRHLFPEILAPYDIWGFSDFDLVFGNIRDRIDFGSLPERWGRIFDFGHFALFPNREEVNTIFCCPTRGFDSWSFIKDSRLIWIYDERYDRGLGGVNGLLRQKGFEVRANLGEFVDVHPMHCGFIEGGVGDGPNLFFHWDGGALRKVIPSIGEEPSQEICYAHFQKRDVQVTWLGDEEALITPSHWPEPVSVGHAVELALGMRQIDQRSRATAFDRSRQEKFVKWVRFLQESLSRPAGMGAVPTFLRGLQFDR